MKTALLCLVATAAFTVSSRAVLTTFSYTQSDGATGSGTIAPFTYNDGGGDINFGAASMPAASVFNPQPGLTPAGFVGAQTVATGNSNEGNVATGLLWSGSVIVTGTRGANTYTMSIPLLFVPKQTQAPDSNDYNWSVAFGDNQVGGNDTVSTSMRFAMYFGRDTVIDAVETANTFQRYTQVNHTFGAGVQDSFLNTTTTTTAIKDATDGGAPAGTDAAGLNLDFYFGWRDQGALTSGAILVDSFAVGGLLNADESSLQLVVPEPSAGLLALSAAGLLFRRRR